MPERQKVLLQTNKRIYGQHMYSEEAKAREEAIRVYNSLSPSGPLATIRLSPEVCVHIKAGSLELCCAWQDPGTSTAMSINTYPACFVFHNGP